MYGVIFVSGDCNIHTLRVLSNLMKVSFLPVRVLANNNEGVLSAMQ